MGTNFALENGVCEAVGTLFDPPDVSEGLILLYAILVRSTSDPSAIHIVFTRS